MTHWTVRTRIIAAFAAQVKADFYSMVTHDLRNPAGNVRVATKMLKDGKGGPLTPKQM